MPKTLRLPQKNRSRYKTELTKENRDERMVGGILFHSRAEARRYVHLRACEKRGEIYVLETQKVLSITLNGSHCFKYIADFCYELPQGQVIYEDLKGFVTEIYRLKKKIVQAFYQISINEIPYNYHDAPPGYTQEVKNKRKKKGKAYEVNGEKLILF